MPKDSPRPKQFEWRVVRIKSTPAAIVGYVQAPDAEQAIKAAIERYEISSPIEQARLAAQCVKRSAGGGVQKLSPTEVGPKVPMSNAHKGAAT